MTRLKQVINIDRNSGEGIYKQIAEQVREAVKSGVLNGTSCRRKGNWRKSWHCTGPPVKPMKN